MRTSPRLNRIGFVISMRRRPLINHLLSLCGLLLCVFIFGTATAKAQASSSLAEVRGQVTDSTGAVIPNATVTLTDAARGTTRTAVTDENGEYVFLAIQPTEYELKVEAASGNFAPSTTRVTLTIGQQANLPVQLSAGGVAAQVDITSGDEVVEIERTQQSTVITPREILTLPLSRRNYLDLALLTPGVSDSDNISDASDARVAQGRASGLSFGGSNGRGNLVTVDGGPVITTTGGVFDTVSTEAVQEFQVLRNSYNAEFGLSSGGIVNTVTKSGTNSISGSVFGLFRDDKFDARNPFDFNPNGQSEFNRQQFGGSFGAPIKRDHTFFFAAYERFNQNQNTFVNLLNTDNFRVTSTQDALFTFLQGRTTPINNIPSNVLGGSLRGALTTTATAFPRTVNLFTSASGQFPFDANQSYFSARVDHTFDNDSSGYIRVHANDLLEENQAAGALTAVSRGRTLNQFNTGILASYTQQIGANAVNEIKVDFIYYKSRLTPNDPFGPEINIEGFGNFGRDIFLPSVGFQRNFDIIDNISFVRGDHTIKFGVNLFAVAQTDVNETFFGGRFNFGAAIPLSNVIALNPALGTATLAALNTDLRTINPNLCVSPLPAGTPLPTPSPTNPLGLCPILAQPINALQSFNLNLPIVYQQGFGADTISGNNIRTGFYAQDTWKVRQNLTFNYGLRYSINREPFGLNLDKNDFQPRAGFAYDIGGDGKTVIRGGAGIFSAYVNRLVSGVIRTLGNPNFPDDNINIILATATSGALPLDPANPTGPRLPSSFAVYQRLLAVTNGFTRSVTPADLAVFGVVPRENSTLEVRFIGDPEYKTPESYQASLAIERDLGAGFSFEASYLYNRGIYLTRNRDVNQFRQTGAPNPLNPGGGPTFVRSFVPGQGDFRNGFRFQDNQYESSANSFYNGATFTVRRRFAQNFSVLSHYTFSKTIDEVTDFNSDFSAQNPLNLRADRALSAFDQRHRVVLTGVFQVPQFDDSIASKIFGDFVLAPIFTYGSGKPFNLLLGFDANNDGRSQSDRPGAVGRNTGKGEDFYSFDMRLSRRFNFSERRYIEVIAEGFNLFNRTNLLGINNVVGGLTVAQRNELIVGTARGNRNAAPTSPLGFTSAAPARQFQFGARFGF
ncbi:MAG: TonB-dependent receptor [Acidobacteriota bacterium]|nr:TonB-dependent receptor [Acidobacteriota bacterium]